MRIRRLILLRHGQTEFNADSRMQGQLDTVLSDLGRAQAGAAADVLRKRHPLMGRALEVLTDKTAERGGIIETLTRVIGAVDWDPYASGTKDPYALLYEKFLANTPLDFFRIVKDTGLLDGQGKPRKAFETWQAWLKAPRK